MGDTGLPPLPANQRWLVQERRYDADYSSVHEFRVRLQEKRWLGWREVWLTRESIARVDPAQYPAIVRRLANTTLANLAAARARRASAQAVTGKFPPKKLP